jgi:hypothetical protein
MSAFAEWANAQKKAQSGHPTGVKSVKWMNQKNIFHLVNFYQSTLAFAGVFQRFLRLYAVDKTIQPVRLQ